MKKIIIENVDMMTASEEIALKAFLKISNIEYTIEAD